METALGFDASGYIGAKGKGVSQGNEVDIAGAWLACKQSGAPPSQFAAAVNDAMRHYSRDLEQRPRTPSGARKQIFNRLRNQSKKMLKELEDLPQDVFWELGDMYYGNEPEDFDETVMGTDYEGLSPFEYDFDLLQQVVGRLKGNLGDVEKIHKRTTGRPKQNAGLERAIQILGKVFEDYSGQSARYGLSPNAYAEKTVYRGDFMPFLKAVIWSYSGREFPQETALGEAARHVFGLR